MKKALFVGDFACKTGFATVLTNLANNLRNRWEIDVLAINYYGDPDPIQKKYNIYPAGLEGDVYGMNRINRIIAANKYDIVFILNDIWIINPYLEQISKLKEKAPPVVFYTPVDAIHLKKHFVDGLKRAAYGIFYTQFGRHEAVKQGLAIPSTVIPHGVDQDQFYFMPKDVARKEVGVPEDWYIALMVDRNQIRKRIDLGIYYFSEWVKRTNKPDNVKLYFHGALRDHMGWDIPDIITYYDLESRFIITHNDMTMQTLMPLDKLKYIYNSADVFVKSCASEGWGLTLHEAMACTIPSVVPESSAMAEWPRGGVEYMQVHKDIPNWNPGGVNTIMDTPTLDSYIEAMEKLYNDAKYRKELGIKGYKIATRSEFVWKNIADKFHNVFEMVTA